MNHPALSCVLILYLLLAAVVEAPAGAPTLSYRVVAEHPHDPGIFTQGLLYNKGQLVQSSGGYGQSFVAVTSLDTGERLRTRMLPATLFAEGIARSRDELYLLTWHAGRGLVLDADSLALKREFFYDSEGWGLAFDGTHFIRSDGTAKLRFHRPGDFAAVRTVVVRDGATPVPRLNELEYAGGVVLANVWKTDRVAAIDPVTGLVRAWLDLAPLRARIAGTAGVANGLALDPATRRLLVTGKRWDRLFVIEPDPGLW